MVSRKFPEALSRGQLAIAKLLEVGGLRIPENERDFIREGDRGNTFSSLGQPVVLSGARRLLCDGFSRGIDVAPDLKYFLTVSGDVSNW